LIAPSQDPSISNSRRCNDQEQTLTAGTAKTRSVTAHVPVQLAEKVDLMAERLERSRNWIVKQALSAWIDQEEERSRLTHEAFGDVDAGVVIDHRAVQAWADSLSTDTPLPVPR
jgi:predicted transcriptional regulator